MDTAKDIVRNLPSTEEILRALGLRAYHETHYMSGIALFGAGLLVGAGLALLFAPTSGRELRDQVGERAQQARERATEVAEQAAESLGGPQARQAVHSTTRY